MKLYRLENGIGSWYVLALNPTAAETKLMNLLDELSYGFSKDRVVKEFHLIAIAPPDKRFITDHFLIL